MWVLYGLLSFENRMSRWILNIEPPTGRGSATRLRLTVLNAGPTSLMNWRNGSLTDSSYRSLFALNQSRSLLRFSSRRNAKVSSPKYPIPDLPSPLLHRRFRPALRLFVKSSAPVRTPVLLGPGRPQRKWATLRFGRAPNRRHRAA